MSRAVVLLLLLTLTAVAHAETAAFSQFSADLPPGWSGEENTGFSSKRGDEYMLVFNKYDADRENILGVVSIYLLPPLPESAKEIAKKLASNQEESSTPRKEDFFWTFSGEPRTQGFKAPAVTLVNATPARVLIIIVQDPENAGGNELLASLKGLTPEAREVLGR
ncbi:MAG: protoporphyrinogen oxidase [Desulfovibrio sp.]|nr:protoporphyrinogen oxidase [Desulfovibrio sp.]